MSASIAELLDIRDAQRRADVEAFRRARAELEVLYRFDELRTRLGHDYGCGQRRTELARRDHELGRLRRAVALAGVDTDDLADTTKAELEEAYRRLLAPRARRAARDRARFIGGRGVGPDRVIKAAELVAVELELHVDTIR
jgi:hypothetical protein